MSFVTLYKSVPQVSGIVLASAGTITITAVNINYTKLTILGFGSRDGSGTVNKDQFRITLTNSTTITLAGSGQANVLVEEFNQLLFRQAFQYGTVLITGTNATGTANSGLTLGTKAHVVSLGFTSTIVASVGSLAEAQISATLSLNVATGVITATRSQTTNIASGIVTMGYLLIDPR